MMRYAVLCFGSLALMGLLLVGSDAPTTLAQDVKGKAQKKATPATGAGPTPLVKAMKDFKIELIYTVPRATQGSWVNICVDPEGRLVASDQGNAGLFRITPPAVGGNPADIKVEKMVAPISGANGLLYAFDSLYVMVCAGSKGPRPNGLYRVTASKPGGELDQVQLLRAMKEGGDHGPHAIVLSPDGKSLFVVAGNSTKITELSGSVVPRIWGEDRLFPILATFGGVVPPAGWICKLDPEGKNWELWSMGYRNPFDIAFNRHGDLFTFDSDMEWDMNTPWYRPTRVSLAASGTDHGFRNGSNNSPPRNIDNTPPILDIGPGSPTGITFGYGAKFPAKYQEALFLCDWSYGRLFAMHLTPDGSSYKGQAEEVVIGTPFQIADMVINPKDGAMYLVTGGRGSQSYLYRLTYTGKESTAPFQGDNTGAEARALRHKLESLHKKDASAVATAWPYLGDQDRFIRQAARTAIEHQDPKEWQELALKETKPMAAINALCALVRSVGQDPVVHPRKSGQPIPGVQLKAPILAALGALDWAKLTDAQACDLVRVYTILVNRLGKPDDDQRAALIQRLDAALPSRNYELNVDLCQLLVYLEAPGVAGKALQLMAKAPSQEEQMDYAKSLSYLKSGWTLEQRKEYFAWYQKAGSFKGGQSFTKTVGEMKQYAMATLSAKETEELRPFLKEKAAASTAVAKARPLVKQWTVDELTPIVEKGLTKRDFDNGRQLFGEAKCYSCHRYGNEGGALGPDLTQAAGRLNVRDLLESIVEPSKVISDQYAATVFTLKDGRIIVGRVVNLHGAGMSVQTDMSAPAKLTNINVDTVQSQELSKVSPMPTNLLDTFREDEILDLVAYILSRGDRNQKMYQTQEKSAQLPAPDADGFISLFNGKDLTNWEGLEGYWSVKDGVIQGSETKDKSKQTFLILSASRADPAKFANFEMHLKYKFATPTGNSGVQFRSKVIDEKIFGVGGYQADFDGASQYDGGFYDEKGGAGNRGIMAVRGEKTTWDAGNKRKNEPLAKSKADLAKLINKGDWNSMILTAKGNRMTITINGELMGDLLDDSPKAVKEGVIAIQMHAGYTMTIQVKDVKIKLLKA